MEVKISEIIHDSYVEELDSNAIIVKFIGCNYNCKFCEKYNVLEEEELVHQLKKIKKDLRPELSSVKYIYIAGEEPTLQRQSVMFFAKFAKENGLKVALKTNGTKPDVISNLIKEDMLDDVVFCLYSPLEEELFNRVTKSSTYFISANEIMGHIRQSLAILKENNDRVMVVFKSMVVPTLVFKKEHFLSMAEIVSQYDNSFWDIYPFDPTNVKDRSFSSINPPTREFVDIIKENVVKEYPTIRIL